MSRRSPLLLAGGFAALAVLVAAGVFTHLDQWSIDHLMPGAHFSPHARSGLVQGLVPLYGSGWKSAYEVAVNLVTLPASFLISLSIAAAWSRALAVVLVAAVAVESLCKEVLERPRLYDGSIHIVAFNSSFPSGHTLRTLIVAAAVASAWPRLRFLAFAWAAAAIVLILLAGWHTPSDIAGGLALGALALLGARAAGAFRRRRLA